MENQKRKRGRPAGKSRAPLTLEERRARNAQYEKERRSEAAEAMAQLAASMDCPSSMSHSELLATVVNNLRSVNDQHPSEDIEALRRCNASLKNQVKTLKRRLAGVPHVTERCHIAHGTERFNDEKPDATEIPAIIESQEQTIKPEPLDSDTGSDWDGLVPLEVRMEWNLFPELKLSL